MKFKLYIIKMIIIAYLIMEQPKEPKFGEKQYETKITELLDNFHI